MNPTFLRTATLLSGILFDAFFLPTVFGGPDPSLSVLFAFSLSFSLLRGFRRAWPATAATGLLFDLAMLRVPGVSSAFCVGLSYAAGFSSRRIVTEHGPLLLLAGGTAVSAGIIGYRAVSAMFFGGASVPSVSDLLPTLVLGFASFFVVSALLRRFDRWAASFESPGFIR